MTFFTSYQNYFRSFLPTNQPESKGGSLRNKLEQKTDGSARTSLESPLGAHPLENVRYSIKQLSSDELKELDRIASQTHTYLNSIKGREMALDKNMLQGLQAAEKVIQAIELERESRVATKGKSLLTLIRLAKKLGLPQATPSMKDMATQANRKHFQAKLADQIHEKVRKAVDEGVTEIRTTDELFLLDTEVVLYHLKKTLGDQISPTAQKVWELKYGSSTALLLETQQAVVSGEITLGADDWLRYHSTALNLQRSPLFPFTSSAQMGAVQFFLPKRNEEKLAEVQSLSRLCSMGKRIGVDVKAVAVSTVKSVLTRVRKGEHSSLKDTFRRKMAEQTLNQVGTLLSMGKTEGAQWDAEETLDSLMKLELPEGSRVAKLRHNYFERVWEMKYGNDIEMLRKAFFAFHRGENLTDDELKNCEKLAVKVAYSPLLKYTDLTEITDFFIDDLYTPPRYRVDRALIDLEEIDPNSDTYQTDALNIRDYLAEKYSTVVLDEALGTLEQEFQSATSEGNLSENVDFLVEELAALKREIAAIMEQNREYESQGMTPTFDWDGEYGMGMGSDETNDENLNIYDTSELHLNKELEAMWKEISELYEQIDPKGASQL